MTNTVTPDFPIVGNKNKGVFQSLEKSSANFPTIGKPEKLPKGWRWVKLGEVCETRTGVRNPATEPDKEILYVDISSVDTIRKEIAEANKLLGKDAPSRARQVIFENDVLVSTTRPNLNAVAIVPPELDNQICSTGFCVLRATDRILPDFLFAFVRHESFIEALSDLVKGALYPAVNDKQVKAQLIPLPPLSEQRRIAAILYEQMAGVERARKAAEERLAVVKALPSAFLRAVFPEHGQALPEGWHWVKLGEVLRLRSGVFLPATKMDASGNFAVYGGNGIAGHHNTYMFDEQKVVIGRVGALCGCVHLSKPKSWITDNALYVHAKTCPLDDEFLLFLLTRLDLRQLANQMGQPVISGGSVYAVECALPPLSEQRRIAAILNEQMAGVERARKAAVEELAAINALPAALLRRAFAGEL